MYFSHIRGEYERVVCLYVVVDIDIVSVPDIVLARDLFAYFDYSVPIVIAFKLIRVTPKIEKLRGFCVQSEELVAELEYIMLVMMAGGVESEPIGRNIEFLGGFSGSRVDDTALL